MVARFRGRTRPIEFGIATTVRIGAEETLESAFDYPGSYEAAGGERLLMAGSGRKEPDRRAVTESLGFVGGRQRRRAREPPRSTPAIYRR